MKKLTPLMAQVEELQAIVCGLADMVYCEDLNIIGLKNCAKFYRKELKQIIKKLKEIEEN